MIVNKQQIDQYQPQKTLKNPPQPLNQYLLLIKKRLPSVLSINKELQQRHPTLFGQQYILYSLQVSLIKTAKMMYAQESFTTTIHSQGQPGLKQVFRQTNQEGKMRSKQELRQPMSDVPAKELRQPTRSDSSQSSLQQTCRQLSSAIKTGEGRLAQSAVLQMAKLLKEAPATSGYYMEAIKLVVNYFNKLAYKLQDEQQQQPWLLEEEPRTEYLMLQALSVISQIITDKAPGDFEFPFTRSFIQSVFMVSAELVGVSKRKRQIVRILSVVLCELSSRISLLKEYDMVPRFRQVLLENYKFVQDLNTFNRFNRAIKRVILLSPLTLVEVKKYKLLETIARFTNTQTFVAIMNKMNLCRFGLVQRNIVVDPNLQHYVKSSAYS